MTRYCFNPKDPTLTRYVLTEALLDENFVECPPPTEPIPSTMLGAEGGVLDQASATLAKEIRKTMGKIPTDAEMQALTQHLLKLDPKALVSAMEHAADFSTPPAPPAPPVAPPPTTDPVVGAMASVTGPPADVPATQLADAPAAPAPDAPLHMSAVPQVPLSETAEDAVKRIFGKAMAQVTKQEICGKSIKSLKVQLDMSKQKKDLVTDYQLAEMARRA